MCLRWIQKEYKTKENKQQKFCPFLFWNLHWLWQNSATTMAMLKKRKQWIKFSELKCWIYAFCLFRLFFSLDFLLVRVTLLNILKQIFAMHLTLSLRLMSISVLIDFFFLHNFSICHSIRFLNIKFRRFICSARLFNQFLILFFFCLVRSIRIESDAIGCG